MNNTHSQSHIPSLLTYLLVWAALLILLALTIFVGFFDLGSWNFIIAMAIAVAKALLVLIFFMHLKYGDRQAWFFAAAGFLWLSIIIVFVLADYLTRGWLIRS